ncbi:MAG: ABC transporter substrate-binding protein [Pseudomonadota bacterium]
MRRRRAVQALAATGALGLLPWSTSRAESTGAASVDALPPLEGELTLYLGRGEGGLYEKVLQAIEQRNPKLKLGIRRGPTAALANAIIAEGKAGVLRADVFWAVDSGAIGLVSDAGLGQELPDDLVGQLQGEFQYPNFVPVTGRIRTLPYHSTTVLPAKIPKHIMDIPDAGLSLGWAPAYASFQSFVTAMRILEGDSATADWLRAVKPLAKSYAGELGVVLGAARGEVDVGFANHYYTLRLKAGKPDARVDLAFTHNDAGCLVNASCAMPLGEGDLPINFIRYLMTQEVQSYLAREAYEIPLVKGVAPPQGLPALDTIDPPNVNLIQLADLRPTLELMRNVGIL